jgi:hypothetical protein
MHGSFLHFLTAGREQQQLRSQGGMPVNAKCAIYDLFLWLSDNHFTGIPAILQVPIQKKVPL